MHSRLFILESKSTPLSLTAFLVGTMLFSVFPTPCASQTPPNKAECVLIGRVTWRGEGGTKNSLKDRLKSDAFGDKWIAVSKMNFELDPHFRLHEDASLEGAFVWVDRADTKSFQVDEAHVRKPSVCKLRVVDGIFEEQTLGVFAGFFKGEKAVQAGSSLRIENVNCPGFSLRILGDPFTAQSSINSWLGTNKSIDVQVGLPRKFRPVEIRSDCCNWLKAHCLPMSHPYFASTTRAGSFEIRGVPAGVPLKVHVWHPSLVVTKEAMREITLVEGKNEISFSLTDSKGQQ